MQEPTNVPQSNSLAIASLVIGIVALLTALFFIGGVLGVAAVVLGIIALRKRAAKSMAIAGIVLGSIAIVISTISIILAAISIPIYQKEQNDISRKMQVGLIVSEIDKYKANNEGSLPDSQVIAGSLKTAKLNVVSSGTPTTSTAVYKAGTTCNGAQNLTAFSVTTLLENGEKYCKD